MVVTMSDFGGDLGRLLPRQGHLYARVAACYLPLGDKPRVRANKRGSNAQASLIYSSHIFNIMLNRIYPKEDIKNISDAIEYSKYIAYLSIKKFLPLIITFTLLAPIVYKITIQRSLFISLGALSVLIIAPGWTFVLSLIKLFFNSHKIDSRKQKIIITLLQFVLFILLWILIFQLA
jgi:hypothetical protein